METLIEPKKIRGLRLGKNKILMFRCMGYLIYMVPGSMIRAQWADFLSGHALVYRFIPRREIWIDDSFDRKEWLGFLTCHELLEHMLMRIHHWKYERAHEAANSLEQELRARAEQGTGLNRSVVESVLSWHMHHWWPGVKEVGAASSGLARQLWRYC